MTEFDPKKYLNQIRYIDSDIKSRREEVTRLRASIAIKTSTLKSDVVQEARIGQYDDKYMLLVEKLESIDDKVDKLVDTKIKVSNEIDMIDDRLSRIILREKYLNLKTFEQVADVLGYDPRRVYTLHGTALELFKQVMLEQCISQS